MERPKSTRKRITEEQKLLDGFGDEERNLSHVHDRGHAHAYQGRALRR